MKPCTIFSLLLTVFFLCFFACSQPAGMPDGNEPEKLRETETEVKEITGTPGMDEPENQQEPEPETEEAAEEPADYSINLNAINRKDASMNGGNYQDNPLLGYEWQPGANGGFTYFFKQDGTVSSTHHCELVFDNQFSYALYRNFLVTYGQEMSSGERLEAWTLHPAGEKGELVLFKRGLLDGSLIKYDIYERASVDPSPGKGATPDAPAAPPWTPFLGSWTASDGSLWSFNADGSYVVTPSSGVPEEYRYLARRDRLVTISSGELETVNSLIQWKTFPRVSEQTFAISGSVITLGGGLTLNRN